MFPTVYCLSQPYDAGLALLAVAICLAASAATFGIYPRALAAASSSKHAPLWIVLTTITAASAIWATHFTAMLAFEPGAPVGFNTTITAVSLVVAIVITALAFSCATYERSRLGTICAGVALGAATATMHYTGVSGMVFAGQIRWNIGVVVLSVVFAIGFSVAALVCCGSGKTFRQRAAGAVLFSVSIASLHFTGMAALTTVANARKHLPSGLLSGDLLAVSVGVVTLLVVAAAAATWLVDLQARRESESRIRFMARHDQLTSLPNRLRFEEKATRHLANALLTSRIVAILCIDLDRFKEVNDIFGHAAGDTLLVDVARRLRCLPGNRVVVGRLGGDEFAVLLPDLADTTGAPNVAQAIIAALATPFEIEGNLIDIGCSVGVALFPRDGTSYNMLLSHADVALSRAKADGRGVFRMYEAWMDEALREKRRLAHDLRAAIGTPQIRLVFQPQVKLSDETVNGFEALLRWDHPELGAIPPSTFIPIAEESGTIMRLGEWVLREACAEAATWRPDITVAVNISIAQFRQAGLVDMISAILLRTGLPPRRLEIEITESLFLESVPRTVQVLERLKALGIRISMDDFGTGFSSLSTLQSFAFDKIKIDRSFISQIGETAKGTAIVRTVVGLAEALGMTVVAEGVESADQVAFLRRQSCCQAQGYFFGRPMPIEHFSADTGPAAPAELAADAALKVA